VQLSKAERQPCEVWTRVMGYHRPVASFNIGKQGEHAERQFFAEQ
jgi:anaerobic ribonucleoside-triphosphate reductase